MKNDLEVLNEFLIKVGQLEGVGIRRKIVIIQRFIKTLTEKNVGKGHDKRKFIRA